jgi:hypothetical protein
MQHMLLSQALLILLLTKLTIAAAVSLGHHLPAPLTQGSSSLPIGVLAELSSLEVQCQ